MKLYYVLATMTLTFATSAHPEGFFAKLCQQSSQWRPAVALNAVAQRIVEQAQKFNINAVSLPNLSFSRAKFIVPLYLAARFKTNIYKS